MIGDIKRKFVFNTKNLIGWRTNRKLVVFSVDDYGNVRLHSKKARRNMDSEGLRIHNRFDALDTLETRADLEALYEVLTSVEDRNGRYAVFTPFAVPCNINFEKVAETGYQVYHYESLTETFEKLSDLYSDAYKGAWDLWKEGMEKKLMVPQFHGREHLNVKVFEEKLEAGDPGLLTSLKNRSFTSISESGYSTISPMAAFDFWSFKENDRFHQIIVDGLNQFENVFGFRSTHFTPPVFNAHPVLYKTLADHGIRFVDTSMIVKEHQGKGRFKKRFKYTGKITDEGLVFIVRNVVFEPADKREVDWVDYAMKQIEAAFRWNRPAIISSHRVNFCGHIDEDNRKKGLQALQKLLKKIVRRWPEVEFMAANELGDLIAGNQ